MNAVWNSYGQLCGCPEIFKKSCKFFCRELDIRVTEILKLLIRWKRWLGIALMRFSQLERGKVGELTEGERRNC